MEQGGDDRNSPNSGETALSTLSLIARAQEGNARARDTLALRYGHLLKKWAYGRLPRTARHRADTDDLVQITLIKAMSRLQDFRPQGEGAFTAYLHRILISHLQDEIRWSRRRPERHLMDLNPRSGDLSPERQAMEDEFLAAYRDVLATLPETQQQAIVLRLELGHTFREISDKLPIPSANAARMLVTRGLEKLRASMKGDHADSS